MSRELGGVGVDAKFLETLLHAFVANVEVLPRLLVLHSHLLCVLQEVTESPLFEDAHQSCMEITIGITIGGDLEVFVVF